MILKIPGGIVPALRGNKNGLRFERLTGASALCLDINGAPVETALADGTFVRRGTLLATVGGAPVYSPLAGRFRGVMTLENGEFLVVVPDGSDACEIFVPETRPLTDLSFDDIASSLKRLAVYDTRSGKPLWEMMRSLRGKCRRVIIDCTESDPLATASLRICLSKSKEVVGGAKILVHAMSAGKAIIAAEADRDDLFARLTMHPGANFPLTAARLEVKYPYSDRALIRAIYVKDLAPGATAADEGCLVVSAETAAAVYDCMTAGCPMLDRRISVCGEVGREANFIVPLGMTVHEIVAAAGGTEGGVPVVENSLLCGKPANGAVGYGTRALIAADGVEKRKTECIGCGSCAEVCPMRLVPSRAAFGKVDKETAGYCVGCGCCEYICPAGIPLMKTILRAKGGREDGK